MAWLIVYFCNDLCVSIVSEKWIKKNGRFCYFPKTNAGTKIRNETPVDKKSGNWGFHACRILMRGKKYATFQEAKNAEKIAQDHSTMTSFENSYAAKRDARKHPKVYNDSSASESDGADKKIIEKLTKLDNKSVSSSEKKYTYHGSFDVDSMNDEVNKNGSDDGDDGVNGSDDGDDGVNGADDGDDGMNGSDDGDDGMNGSDEGMNGSDDGMNESDDGEGGMNDSDDGDDCMNGSHDADDGVNDSDDGVNDSDDGVNDSDDGVNDSDDGVNDSDDGVNGSDDGVDGSDDGVNVSDDGVNSLVDGYDEMNGSDDENSGEADGMNNFVDGNNAMNSSYDEYNPNQKTIDSINNEFRPNYANNLESTSEVRSPATAYDFSEDRCLRRVEKMVMHACQELETIKCQIKTLEVKSSETEQVVNMLVSVCKEVCTLAFAISLAGGVFLIC